MSETITLNTVSEYLIQKLIVKKSMDNTE